MDGDLHIGEWLIQPSLSLISSGEKKVSIEPKVMDALLYLASHPGEVVTKEHLIQTVWSGSFVTDDVVAHAISELRKAFQDDIRDPAVIRTVPKRGYQLIAPVHSNGLRSRLSGDEMVPRSWKWLAFGAICAVVTLGTGLIWLARSDFGQPIDSIAVLPLQARGPTLRLNSGARQSPADLVFDWLSCRI